MLQTPVPEHSALCKQKPTKHITENGDPLAHKMSKIAKPPACAATQSSIKITMTTMSSKVSTSASLVSPPYTQSHTQQHHAAIETDGNTEEPSTEPELIKVSNSDSLELIEDDDTELSACDHTVFDFESVWNANWMMCPDQLSKDWDAPIYAFFKPTPLVDYIKNHKAHIFVYMSQNC